MTTVKPLKIVVVGHTNTGKTSLLRTLTGDVAFGEISDRPATTRHVEGVSLNVAGRSVVQLFDTPGLEDSISLLEYLERKQRDRRIDAVSVIKEFVDSEEANQRFSQEAKAIRQVFVSDLALYVIDVRDRLLGKHRDELEILSWCARPIVPILNFTASKDALTARWRDHLAKLNLHTVAEFDTVVLEPDTERRLFEKLSSLLDSHRATLNALLHEREQKRHRIVKASAERIADLLIDVAAFVEMIPRGEMDSSNATEDLKQHVRDREQQCVDELLTLHRFRKEDCERCGIPLIEGRWGIDVFSPAALKQFGIQTGGAAAAGALAGLTVDVMFGGLSLGAASAVGAVIGAVLGAGRLHGKKIVDRIRGFNELRCDENTLRLMFVRQIVLVDALLRRGHASLNPIALEHTSKSESSIVDGKFLPLAIHEARVHSEWSRLRSPPDHSALAGSARRHVQLRLASEIESRIPFTSSKKLELS